MLMTVVLLGPSAVGHTGDAQPAASSTTVCLTKQLVRDASRVMKCIRERGASAVLAELREDKDDEMWDKVTDAIWNGRGEWLNIAVELRKVSDAGTSFDLEVAWSNAVIKNPVGVLALTPVGDDHRFHLETVCAKEAALGDTFKKAIKSIHSRRRAVESVHRADLLSKRKTCLAQLDSLEEEVVRHRNDWFIGGSER